MFGPLFIIVALLTLPAMAAKLVAVFFLIYGIKIVLEELANPEVPDARKAWISVVLGLTLHVLIFHADWIARIHNI